MHRLTVHAAAWLGAGYALLLAGCSVPTDDAAPPSPPPAPETVVQHHGPEPGRKMLLMHYMPWYKTPDVRGSWGAHWTGYERQHNPDALREDGLPDLYSHYNPLIGAYDSTDRDVLECQLLQMKIAGVDGVIADWYGIGQTANYPEIHEATQALFDLSGAFDMAFAACYEDRTIELMVNWGHLQPEQVTNHLAETFRWLENEWFSQPHYVHWQERPLLLNFGPMYLRDPAAWEAARAGMASRPLLFALHHLWRRTGADGGFSWVHHDPFEDPDDARTIRIRLGEVFSYYSQHPGEAIVSAYPGFNDIYPVEQHRELDHREGRTLRETLEVGMAGPWEIIQLVTWNDYGEGTMIEPTEQFGYLFLEIIQEARRAEAGGTFPYTAADLRLPAQLLAERRAGVRPAAELDQIAEWIRNGEMEKARQYMYGHRQ